MVNEENVKAMLEDFRKDKEYTSKKIKKHLSTYILIMPSEIEQVQNEIGKEAKELAKKRLEGCLRKYPREDVVEAAKRNFLYNILDSIPPEKYNPFIQ